MAKITTLWEIENHWSIDDLVEAHVALNMKDEAEEIAAKSKGAK